MSNNSLSKSLNRIPMWLIQAVVGIGLTVGATWVGWSSTTIWKHEVRISSTETSVSDVKSDLADIKANQREAIQKIDRLADYLMKHSRGR